MANISAYRYSTDAAGLRDDDVALCSLAPLCQRIQHKLRHLCGFATT